MTEIIQPNVTHYDIQWDKIKTIKDLKSIIRILASKVVIDHNDEDDIKVYEILEKFLIKSAEQNFD